MNLTIKILCCKCSEEFTLKNVEHNNCIKASVANFEDCPHCGERNDYWLKIDWPEGYISTEKAEAEHKEIVQEKLRQQRVVCANEFERTYEDIFTTTLQAILNAKIDD